MVQLSYDRNEINEGDTKTLESDLVVLNARTSKDSKEER